MACYLARDLIFGWGRRYLALHELLQTSHCVARFQREAKAMAELTIQRVVRIADIGEEEGQQYLAMEYVAGLDWKRHKENAFIKWRVVRLSILLAMRLAHTRGIIHRDLKPECPLDTRWTKQKFQTRRSAFRRDYGPRPPDAGVGSLFVPEQARVRATVQSGHLRYGDHFREMLTGHIPMMEIGSHHFAAFSKPIPIYSWRK